MLATKNKIAHHQFIKISEFRRDIRRTAPHRHNSYIEFIFLSKGSGFHTIDGKPYNVSPPLLFTVRKEQVHHWEITDEPEGYVLIIKRQYVAASLDKALGDLLSKVSAHTCVHITAPEPLTALFKLLLDEWQSEKAGSYSQDVVDGLMKALLAKVLQLAQPKKPQHVGASDIFQRFEALLRDTSTLQNNVAHYAELLNTSPQNLNAVCRKAVGESAASVVARHLLSEAKRLLLYTDMGVGEIATRLDFSDNSHFTKYFKRHTGTTPNVFRQHT
ncbi:helix-turn-helix domain-containing protein [Parapedobacter deserti]|uniref:Helix-turn-helix domain-containing protein n=1 Tax=Parapedobacter deserti TaxID=1912957 RepID=A0ABV7JQG6_9SPHI